MTNMRSASLEHHSQNNPFPLILHLRHDLKMLGIYRYFAHFGTIWGVLYWGDGIHQEVFVTNSASVSSNVQPILVPPIPKVWWNPISLCETPMFFAAKTSRDPPVSWPRDFRLGLGKLCLEAQDFALVLEEFHQVLVGWTGYPLVNIQKTTENGGV